jgi:putative transposase
LGITPSFSRPRVSDDNPYSESLFKTLKYTAGYPRFFTSLQDSRMWTADFVHWYNTKHKHSGIVFITPEQQHNGRGRKILSRRNQRLLEAYATHPERWSSKVKTWDYQETVYLNPAAETKQS